MAARFSPFPFPLSRARARLFNLTRQSKRFTAVFRNEVNIFTIHYYCAVVTA